MDFEELGPQYVEGGTSVDPHKDTAQEQTLNAWRGCFEIVLEVIMFSD